jgi:hypothetical protein
MEQSAPPAVPYCPMHKAPDHIHQVSALYAEASPEPLSPWPVLKAAGRLAWTGTGCGILGMVSIWIGNVIGGGAVGPALLAALFCFGYALAFYGWAAARKARLTRVENGKPGALKVWREAWYCERCDGVFLPAGRVGDAGQLMSAAEFRQLVWAAGGYDDLGRRGTPGRLSLPLIGKHAGLTQRPRHQHPHTVAGLEHKVRVRRAELMIAQHRHRDAAGRPGHVGQLSPGRG